MIGKNTIELDAKDFVKGMSSSDHIADGGFSSKGNHINLTKEVGVIYSPASLVDSDTDNRLTGNIIATTEDDDGFLGYERKMVTSDGKYYRYNATKIPEAALRTDAVNTYAVGFTDMITFDNEIYVTTKEKLVRWDEGAAVFNASFASFTKTTYPHPAIVYENNAFYADGNVLKKQTSAGGALSAVLTLSADQIIITLGIDPGTGYMLISTTSSLNASDTLRGTQKVLFYDGFSNKPIKAVIVDDMVLSFYSVGGTVFVGYGQNIGYFNGSGITFLRKLANVTLSGDEILYKHKITNIGNRLYVVDGRQVLVFGEIQRNNKVFYYAVQNKENTNKLISIFDVGSGKLGMSFDINQFFTFDTTSVATTYGVDFYSNKFNFPRPVIIRSAFVEYANAVSNAVTPLLLYIYDEKQNSTQFSSFQNTTGAAEYFRESLSLGVKVRTLQIYGVLQNANPGIRRIIISYDVAE